jgi:hypothetical protein
MSCGKPHETPCNEVLDLVYWYLDGEVSEDDCDHIRQHLAVKRLVAKHCGCDPVPTELRSKVLVRIKQVQAEIELTE